MASPSFLLRSKISIIILALTNANQVTIVTISLGHNQLSGYFNTGPFMDVAFDLASTKYPEIFRNISRLVVYREVDGSSSCSETGDMMHDVAAEVFDFQQKSHGFFILLSPGCTLEMIVLGDFAREMKIPLFASTAADGAFTNRVRFPTMTLFSSGGQGITSNAILYFMKIRNWRTVTVLCDTLSQAPSVSTFYLVTCRAIRSMLTQNRNQYQMYTEQFDSANQTDYDSILQRAKAQSRVIAVCTNGDVMRKIMILAHSLNMTNKNYVFLYTKATGIPQFKRLEWKQNDTTDHTAFKAFQSVIEFELTQANWNMLRHDIETITELARVKYNYTYAADEKESPIALSGFEAVEILAQILNETWPDIELMDGINFTNLALNRTFDLGYQTIRIGSNGFRIRDTIIAIFNIETGRFQDTWFYNRVTQSSTEISPFIGWYGQKDFPPDRPLCGFHDEICDLKAVPFWAMVVIGLVAALLFILAAAYAYWKYRQLYTIWWYVEPCLVHWESVVGVSIPAIGSPEVNAWSFNRTLAVFKNEVVWMQAVSKRISKSVFLSSQKFRKRLAELRPLRNQNLGQFYGITFLNNQSFMIWECGRCTLRSFLESHDKFLNEAVMVVLIHDLYKGLGYLHSSALQCHGDLSSLNTIVDHHFSIKICGYGFTAIAEALKIDRDSASYAMSRWLWLSPEQKKRSDSFRTKMSDVYSAAIISCEILTGHTPYGIDLDDIISLRDIVQTVDYSEPPFQLQNLILLPQAVMDNIERSFSCNPRSRPTVSDILRNLKKIVNKENAMAILLQCFQSYSEELETKISARTTDLLEETAKVDTLLKEIMPSIYVTKLRNKEPLPVQSCISATIYFSSLDGFDMFVSSNSPRDVMVLLNEAYQLFDEIIPKYDVYKVETIKDSYMVASGVPVPNGDQHAVEIANMALSLLATYAAKTQMYRGKLSLRTGIHSGPVVAGVVGTRMPRYCLFGDTVNTASRIENLGQAGMIHLSKNTAMLLAKSGMYVLKPRGSIQVKGKGIMETFWLI